MMTRISIHMISENWGEMYYFHVCMIILWDRYRSFLDLILLLILQVKLFSSCLSRLKLRSFFSSRDFFSWNGDDDTTHDPL